VDESVWMRGLEPPPSYLDTDLNRPAPNNMGPPGPERPILLGSLRASDASEGAIVAKSLRRGRPQRVERLDRTRRFDPG
jgi:hypothetical protein